MYPQSNQTQKDVTASSTCSESPIVQLINNPNVMKLVQDGVLPRYEGATLYSDSDVFDFNTFTPTPQKISKGLQPSIVTVSVKVTTVKKYNRVFLMCKYPCDIRIFYANFNKNIEYVQSVICGLKKVFDNKRKKRN
ncbi:hypothetical protein H6F76_02245 [Leptolyngbya sp. FACHB-321]|uniref:hypothetical protein n=1 Tax=Leptolyngbya sp. FACHB-321 TaxID=2692807 RepID=UPI001684786C|nr:hypothetical protein [Leptolyngbya sp. FACHB-321]MBD2033873.1 hypothetical protein [Leptolyngbya sp. FACHB-321]